MNQNCEDRSSGAGVLAAIVVGVLILALFIGSQRAVQQNPPPDRSSFDEAHPSWAVHTSTAHSERF